MGTPRVCRPADYLPSGTVGQWPPATGQWWNERRGGDPTTDQATKGLTQNSRAGNPKRKRPNCHNKEVLSNQRGLQQRNKWSKSHDPWRRGATGFCEPQKITVVTA